MNHLDAALFALDYWQSTGQHHTLQHSRIDFEKAWLSPSLFFPTYVRELCAQNNPAEPQGLLKHLDSAIAFLDGFRKDGQIDHGGLQVFAQHIHQYFPLPSLPVDRPEGSTEPQTYVFDLYGYVLPLWHLAQVHFRTARVALRHKFAVSDSPGSVRSSEPKLNSRNHTDLVQAFASLEAAYGLKGRPVSVAPGSTVSRSGTGPAFAHEILEAFLCQLHSPGHGGGSSPSKTVLTPGLTEPNFAAILHYLGWLLGDRDVALNAQGEPLAAGESPFVNEVFVLLVTPRDDEDVCKGSVLPACAQRVASTGPGLILDLSTFGLMPFDADTSRSLQIAHLIAANELEASQSLTTGVLLSLKPDEFLPIALGGDSAGGLLTLTAVATALGISLDGDATASFTINPDDQPDSLDIAHRVAAHDRSLRAVDFRIGPVGGIPEKLDQEPALTTRSIARVFLSHNQRRDVDHAPWDAWAPALETKTGLVIQPVGSPSSANPSDTTSPTAFASLKTALDLMTGNHLIERLVARHADAIHQKWNAAAHPASTSPRSVIDDHQEHRFDKYVWPNYVHEENALPAGRETVARRETRVPGSGVEQLRTLLHWLIKDNKFLVVYDRAGAGKTVFSWRAEHELTSPEIRRSLFGGHAPLVIRCNGTWPKDEDGKTLLTTRQVIARELSRARSTSANVTPAAPLEKEMTSRAIDYLLRVRRVVFILDGFDQFSEDERQHVVDQLTDRDDTMAFDQCRWIVTGRVHAIEAHNERLFAKNVWSRIRIDPFDKKQQNTYLADLDGRWQQMVPDRKAVAELLGLPLVLKLIRDLIESKGGGEPLPVFRTLSDLFVEASRELLERAITTTAKVNPEVARQTNKGKVSGELLQRLEQVLATLAFEMLLAGHYNAELDNGPEKRVAALERSAQRRVCRDLNTQLKQPDLEPSDRRQYELDLDAAITNFNADLWLLKTIELNHRSITEAFVTERIAFRSRKIMECYAARYLVKFATDADRDALRPFLGDEEWEACWDLAVDMPDREMVVDRALATLGLLFEQPARFPRPTRLLYRTWFRLQHEQNAQLHAGLAPIVSMYRQQFLDILAGKAPVPTLLVDPQLGVNPRAEQPTALNRARRAAESIWDGDLRRYLQPYADVGTLPPGETLETWLAQITPQHAAYALCSNGSSTHSTAQQKSDPASLKTLRFLMGASPKDTNASDREKSTEKPYQGGRWRMVEMPAFKMATCAVTRGQYRLFDAVRENADRDDQYGKDRRAPDDDCPITHVDWFDGFAYGLWLGEGYQLPTERMWEGAGWGGLDRESHPEAVIGVSPYDSTFTSNAVNFYGGVPLPGGEESGWAERTLPVRWDDARRAVEQSRGGWAYLPGEYEANGFGLWQLSGNTYEWCETLFPDGQTLDDQLDGGATGRELHIETLMRCSVRGGLWFNDARFCRCSYRFWLVAGYRVFELGLRLART